MFSEASNEPKMSWNYVVFKGDSDEDEVDQPDESDPLSVPDVSAEVTDQVPAEVTDAVPAEVTDGKPAEIAAAFTEVPHDEVRNVSISIA